MNLLIIFPRKIVVWLSLIALLAVAAPAYGQRNDSTASAGTARSTVATTRLQLNEEALQEVIKRLNDLKPADRTFDSGAIKKLYGEQIKWSKLDEKKADLHISVASALERSAKSTGRPELLEISGLAYREIIEHTQGETRLRASSNYCSQLLRHNQPREAVKVMQAVETILSDNSMSKIARSRSLYNYGRALQLSGDFERAYKVLNKAVEADPDFRKAAQAAGDAALKSSHETTGIPLVVELTNSQLAHLDYQGAARNLRQALLVQHWIGHYFYPQLLGQLVQYFTAARVGPEAFNKDWSRVLNDIRRRLRRDDTSQEMIDQIIMIYSRPLPIMNVDPKRIQESYAVWSSSRLHTSMRTDLGFLSSFIKMVADQYYPQRDVQSQRRSLERYCHAWGVNVENMEAGLYLANVLLYDRENQNRQLDPNEEILDAFINQLFYEKNREYRQNIGKDWERILKCHIVLATIFEQQARWGPDNNPRTALFQWQLAYDALQKLDNSATKERFSPVVVKRLNEARERSENTRPVDFVSGSKAAYVAKFSTWPKVSNEHGYARPEGSYYALEARSNTWVGSGRLLPITILRGDFIVEMSFRVIHKTNCGLSITLSDAGDDYSQLVFYFDIWDSGSLNFSINENDVDDDFYVKLKRKVADRTSVPVNLSSVDWTKGNRLSVKREGNSISFYFNGHLLKSFYSSIFDIKKVGVGLAFKSKILLTSLEARVPR